LGRFIGPQEVKIKQRQSALARRFNAGNLPIRRTPVSKTLYAFLEFEPTDVAAANHAFIVDDVAADDFGHHGQIEGADFRIY
jgi:hypothetical protein